MVTGSTHIRRQTITTRTVIVALIFCRESLQWREVTTWGGRLLSLMY